MPSTSKSQQRLFCMAYAVRKGELSRDKVTQSVLDIADGDMTDKEIKDFMELKENRIIESFENFIKESNSVRDASIGTDDKNREIIVRLIKNGKELYFDKAKLYNVINKIGTNFRNKSFAEAIFNEFKDAAEIEISKDDNGDEYIVGSWYKSELDRGFDEN